MSGRPYPPIGTAGQIGQSVLMQERGLPPDGAPIHEYFLFATQTYDGYERHGDRLAVLANAASEQWRAAGTLPTTEDDLRAALFFEARRWHHFGREPDPEVDRYVRALVARLRSLTDGDRSTGGT